MAFDGFPLVIAWELTLSCNLRCHHCGSSAGMPRAGELELDECLDLCNQFPDLLVQEVDFTGGEPLLMPGWQRLAEKLATLGIRNQIITNGLSLDRQAIIEMQDLGIAALGISLDGMEATHDTIRAHPGLFRRIMERVQDAHEVGMPLTVLTTVNALNVDQLPEMLNHFRSVGINRWQIQPIFPLGRGRVQELQLSDEAYLRLGAFHAEWAPRQAETGVEIIGADSFGYATELDTRTPMWRGCPAGLVTCGIMSNGDIKGCLSLPDGFVEGNVRDHSFWDIWFSPDNFVYNRDYSEAQLGPNCQGCDHADLCKGGCSAMSLGGSGCFHNDPYCFAGIRSRMGEPLGTPEAARPLPD